MPHSLPLPLPEQGCLPACLLPACLLQVQGALALAIRRLRRVVLQSPRMVGPRGTWTVLCYTCL